MSRNRLEKEKCSDTRVPEAHSGCDRADREAQSEVEIQSEEVTQAEEASEMLSCCDRADNEAQSDEEIQFKEETQSGEVSEARSCCDRGDSETQSDEEIQLKEETQPEAGERKIKPTEKPYTTTVNDPDLLVGPYKPIEGQPNTIKCPNCGEEMPTTIDTCVNCGHYLKQDEKRYVPMDEKKVKKIRWIVGIICIIGFVLIMVFSGKWS